MAKHKHHADANSQFAQRWFDYRARARKYTRWAATIGILTSVILMVFLAKWMIGRRFPTLHEDDSLMAVIQHIVRPKPKPRVKFVPPPDTRLEESPVKPVEEPETQEIEEQPIEEPIPTVPVVVDPNPEPEPETTPEPEPVPELQPLIGHTPSAAPDGPAIEGIGAISTEPVKNSPGNLQISGIGDTPENNRRPRNPATASISGGLSQNGPDKRPPDEPSTPDGVDGISDPVSPSPSPKLKPTKTSREMTVDLLDDFKITNGPKPRFPDGVHRAIEYCEAKVKMVVGVTGLPDVSTIKVVSIVDTPDIGLTPQDESAFRREAIRVSREYKFKPVERNRVPQAFRVVITVTFER
jgi:hypothetical protein